MNQIRVWRRTYCDGFLLLWCGGEHGDRVPIKTECNRFQVQLNGDHCHTFTLSHWSHELPSVLYLHCTAAPEGRFSLSRIWLKGLKLFLSFSLPLFHMFLLSRHQLLKKISLPVVFLLSSSGMWVPVGHAAGESCRRLVPKISDENHHSTPTAAYHRQGAKFPRTTQIGWATLGWLGHAGLAGPVYTYNL
jgi:hypothetical protein